MKSCRENQCCTTAACRTSDAGYVLAAAGLDPMVPGNLLDATKKEEPAADGATTGSTNLLDRVRLLGAGQDLDFVFGALLEVTVGGLGVRLQSELKLRQVLVRFSLLKVNFCL